MVKDESSKALFKRKKKRKTIKNKRNQNSDGEEEEEEGSAMKTITSVMKKRRLINNVLGQNRRGIDSSLLLQQTSSSAVAAARSSAVVGEVTNDGIDDEKVTNTDLTQNLKGTFSGGTGGDTIDGGNGVIQRKHKNAMEEFIRSNMTSTEKKDVRSIENGDNNNNKNSEGKGSTNHMDMQSQLYEELASSADRLISGSKEKAANGDTTELPNQQNPPKEGDVGTGGAMIGGTGIAEIALPVDERIKTARETEQAAAAREMARRQGHRGLLPQQRQQQGQSHFITNNDANQMLPSSFGKKKNQSTKEAHVAVHQSQVSDSSSTQQNIKSTTYLTASSAGSGVLRSDVNGVGSSYSHNYRKHEHEWISNRKEEREAELEIIKQKENEEAGPVANQERMGFEASRRAAKGEAPLPSSKEGGATSNTHYGGEGGGRTESKRSTDNRVWRSFVKKEITRGKF